jgi:hypothetical protein
MGKRPQMLLGAVPVLLAALSGPQIKANGFMPGILISS